MLDLELLFEDEELDLEEDDELEDLLDLLDLEEEELDLDELDLEDLLLDFEEEPNSVTVGAGGLPEPSTTYVNPPGLVPNGCVVAVA